MWATSLHFTTECGDTFLDTIFTAKEPTSDQLTWYMVEEYDCYIQGNTSYIHMVDHQSFDLGNIGEDDLTEFPETNPKPDLEWL